MKLTWLRRVAPGILVLALAAPVHAQSFGFPWWRDAQFQKDLTLTVEQSSRIDAVFQATIPNLRQQRQELDEQEAKLSRLIAANVDEAQVIRQVDKVEAIRASANKMRTLMLLRMRQVLTPDQRAKLNKLYEQWEKDHHRGPRGDNKK
jgi:Spy/CpxP family protein refolding chaperone